MKPMCPASDHSIEDAEFYQHFYSAQTLKLNAHEGHDYVEKESES
jgi:hypothetical protein